MDAKSWYTSKTLWVNLGALVAGLGGYLAGEGTAALVSAGLGLVNILLRTVTTQPLGK